MTPEGHIIAGIPVGFRGDRRASVLEAFALRGVKPSNATLADMRSGETTGYHIERIAISAQVLLNNDASGKNNVYLDIIKAGIAQRTYLRKDPHSFNSRDFTHSVASQIGATEGEIRRMFRAMRTEAVYTSDLAPESTRQVLLRLFLPAADRYLNHPKAPQPARIKQRWDGRSLKEFYALLEEGPRAFRGVGVFTPYEMDFFNAFYQQQKLKNKLTPFDEYILISRIHRDDNSVIAHHLRTKTAIRVDKSVISVHFNALVGNPLTKAS